MAKVTKMAEGVLAHAFLFNSDYTIERLLLKANLRTDWTLDAEPNPAFLRPTIVLLVHGNPAPVRRALREFAQALAL